MMTRAFVLKAVDNDIPGYSVPGVWESLTKGKARIGWSYADNLDLRLIQKKVRAGQPLDRMSWEPGGAGHSWKI